MRLAATADEKLGLVEVSRADKIDAELSGFLDPAWTKADGNPWRKRGFHPEVTGAEREKLSSAMDNALAVLGTVPPPPKALLVVDRQGNRMAKYSIEQRRLAENFAAKFPKRGARVVVAT